jgi:hypothetical protein
MYHCDWTLDAWVPDRFKATEFAYEELPKRLQLETPHRMLKLGSDMTMWIDESCRILAMAWEA